MATYIAILRKERKSDYGVSFPDLPGCVSAGKTLEEARTNAREALELHLEGMVEDGLDIPAPAALDHVLEDAEHRDGVPFLVDARDPAGHVVRINITVPEAVLATIDAFAKARSLPRSRVLYDGAMQLIDRELGVARKKRGKAA